jgi:hypothetical protein
MGTPSPGWDSLVQQDRAALRRRRRRRRQQLMLWLLTVVTTVVLLVIFMLVKDMAKTPTVATPAALSSSTRTARGASASATARRVSPRAKPTSPAPGPRVTDSSSGLSYQLLASPWRPGCPAALNMPTLSWSAGENAVAGQVAIGGSSFDWHGNACSGQLQQQFPYSGPADLEPTVTNLVGVLDPAYYNLLAHSSTVEDSSAMQVSGHQAWVVKFLIGYPDATAEGLSWTSELGAVVVVDRGPGQAPAVFYVSVPANLGVSSVDTLIGSLTLS